MYSSPYDSHWSEMHPELSRRAVLEDAFHADTKHPARRLLVDIGMAVAPIAVLAVVVIALSFAG
ncbi:MAG TPA: hypothetical protein VIM02_12225 [Rhizomicrobium sp.]|jgi:hypothetical protein